MAITSLDILNLSHSLKDICEVNCNTPECLSQTLKILMQYNLIQANLAFGRQFCAPPACPCGQTPSASAAKVPAVPSHAPSEAVPSADSAAPAGSPRPPVRLDIGDPFLADYEK